MTADRVSESAQQFLTIVHIAGPAKVGRHTTAGRTLANHSLLLFPSFVISIENGPAWLDTSALPISLGSDDFLYQVRNIYYAKIEASSSM